MSVVFDGHVKKLIIKDGSTIEFSLLPAQSVGFFCF